MKTQNIINSAKRTHSFGIINTRKPSVSASKQKPSNRWHLSAEGFLLLPSALRPHLLGKKCKKSSFRDIFRDKIASNYAKNHQKLQFFAKINGKLAKNTQFWAILALFQIVAASTIFGYLCSTPVSAASLTLTIPSKFSLDVTPGAGGVFSKSEPGNINVKTDNSSGYTLSIKAKNSDNSNVLLNGSNKLNSISEQTSEDNFKSDAKFNNTWGYLPSKFNSADNTNFLPGPTSEESLLETTEEANETGTDYNITLGAKVDNTMSSGSYSNKFVFSVISNVQGPMQNWQGCGSLSDGNTVALVDTRDDNIYTVAKLKDGKCWMTQNLRLGDDKLKNRTLTSEDSNVETDFTLPSSSASGFNKYNTSYLQYVNQEYGTYYSWYAATAGQGTGEDNRNTDTRITTTSICPSGWHLPSKSETTELVSHYDYSTIQESPANFSLAGANRAGVVSDQEIKGLFWAANAYDNKYGYMIVLNNSTGALGAAESFGDKAYGFAVRCVISEKSYSISYELNGGENGPESPQTGKTYEDTVKLSDKTPTKDGYEFLGWCAGSLSYNNTPYPGCYGTGITKKPGDSYMLSNYTNNLTLYAMWKTIIPLAVDKGNLGPMQSFNCDYSLPNIHEYGTVTDSRDDNTYKVAKLLDGKCWMVENLRLGDDKLQNRTLTFNNTDISVSTYQLPTRTNVKLDADGNYDIDALYIDSAHPEYGGYYSWHTATAGTGTASMSTKGENATSSICPKGWKLPTGGSSSDFDDLVIAYSGANRSIGNTNLRATPVPNFVYSGYVYNFAGLGLINKGGAGYYWSSTAVSSVNTYRLNIETTNAGADVGASFWNAKYTGYSVRCVVAPKKITDLQYMQDWGDLSEKEKTQVIDSMQDETNYTLKDKRDDNEYTIAKLKDGKVWMTQNLRLGDSKLSDRTLTSANTDITASTYQLTEQTPENFKANGNYDADALYIDPNHPEYGGYYSWHTATAGTGTWSMSTRGQNATSSICPKGWKLPTGGSSSDFNDLVTAYGGNNSTGSKNLRATPVPGFVYSGWVQNDGHGLAYQGSDGFYWSSTVDSAYGANSLNLDSSNAHPAYSLTKFYGFYVRCVVAP